MRKPFFKQTILVGEDGDDSDIVLGYTVPEDINDLDEGSYVAVYRLIAVKRVRKNPRLESK